MATTARLELVTSPRLPTERELLSPVRRSAQRLLLKGVNHLGSVTPVDQGHLLASLQPDVTLTGVEGGEGGGLPTAVRWGTNLASGAATNAGNRRGPGGQTPVQNIVRWIKSKGISPRPKAGKKRRSQEAEILGMAFAVAKKHAQGGAATGPAYVSGPNASKSTAGWFDTLAPVIDQALDDEIQRLGDEIVAVWHAG